jgi:DNA-binding CsgD family transcriptional regulator
MRARSERDATVQDAMLPGLTRRERDVARLIALGLATKEVAQRLGISPHTARHHAERVFVKLGVNNRCGVAALLGRTIAHSHPVTSVEPPTMRSSS